MFGTDSLCLGQILVFGTDSLCLGQTHCVLKTSFEKNCFSAWASTLNVGLINKLDMVCLSPVGYGVELNTISHRRQTYHINLVDQTHIRCVLDRLIVFGTDLLCLEQTHCVWDRLVVFGTDSLCF